MSTWHRILEILKKIKKIFSDPGEQREREKER